MVGLLKIVDLPRLGGQHGYDPRFAISTFSLFLFLHTSYQRAELKYARQHPAPSVGDAYGAAARNFAQLRQCNIIKRSFILATARHGNRIALQDVFAAVMSVPVIRPPADITPK